MRVWSSLPPERFILKAYVGWLDEDYEAANTLQPNYIFNLRGLSPISYTRRALLAQQLQAHDLSSSSVASVCPQKSCSVVIWSNVPN